MSYLTLDQADIKGKRVLVRIDHNIETDETGKLKSDKKIRATLPTIELLLKKHARVILMTHIGRPKGKTDPKLSTIKIVEHLRGLLPGVSIHHVPGTVGSEVTKAVDNLKDGDILYLENVRFNSEEEGSLKEQERFGRELARLGDVFVNEAFASCHAYEEASTCAVARVLPAYAGIHLQRELTMLSRVKDDPKRPVVLIISGAKMETKIPVVENFLTMGDEILLGGCIANTFIAARGFDIGRSKYEPEYVERCQEMMLEAEKTDSADIHIPRDALVATNPESADAIDIPLEDIEGDMAIFDIGRVTTDRYIECIGKAGMVIWNGPLGYYEVERFAESSKRIAQAVAQATDRGAVTILGGGDTLDLHKRYGLPLDPYTFVSTGGGAMIEFMSGKRMPAFEVLRKVK